MNGRWLKTLISASVLSLGMCVLPAATWAQAALLPPGASLTPPLTVSIDENGVLILNGKQIAPLRLGGVPTFPLGQRVVAGDVLFVDGSPSHPLISDILRFPENLDLGPGWANTIQFLSDNVDNVENGSDVGIPEFQPNHIVVPEDASEVTLYTAGTLDSALTHSSYIVHSDAGMVPEPASLSLLATGSLPLLGLLRRRRRVSAGR